MCSDSIAGRAKTILQWFAVASICCGLMDSAARAESGYQLVINDANPVSVLPKSKVGDIFLRRMTSWPNGQRVQPVDQLSDREVRELFTNDVHDRPVSAIKNHWQRQIFSGRSIPPTELASDQEVMDYVRTVAGGIGYVSGGVRVGGGVKVLRVE